MRPVDEEESVPGGLGIRRDLGPEGIRLDFGQGEALSMRLEDCHDYTERHDPAVVSTQVAEVVDSDTISRSKLLELLNAKRVTNKYIVLLDVIEMVEGL